MEQLIKMAKLKDSENKDSLLKFSLIILHKQLKSLKDSLFNSILKKKTILFVLDYFNLFEICEVKL